MKQLVYALIISSMVSIQAIPGNEGSRGGLAASGDSVRIERSPRSGADPVRACGATFLAVCCMIPYAAALHLWEASKQCMAGGRHVPRRMRQD